MYDLWRDVKIPATSQPLFGAVQHYMCGTMLNEEDLRHLAVPVRCNDPIMQAGAIQNTFAMHDVRENRRLAEEIEERDRMRVGHA